MIDIFSFDNIFTRARYGKESTFRVRFSFSCFRDLLCMDALDLGEVTHAFNSVPCRVAVVLQEELQHEYRLHIASCLNDIWVWYYLRTVPPFAIAHTYCASWDGPRNS